MLSSGVGAQPKSGWRRWNPYEVNFTNGRKATFPMKISRDFKEFIEFANSNSVRFLIVGGYAVAFHGHPRYTKDLDVWIERSPQNARRLLAALSEFGFDGVGLVEDDFLEPEQIIQLGNPPLRIDILTDISGVDFDACYTNRQIVDLDGVEMPFISLADLRANKVASGRHQDLADLENLK